MSNNTIDSSLIRSLQAKIDGKTKPLGALGRLESIARQIGRIQNTTSPSITKPAIVLFAGDHGVADAGVSAYPKEVTYQMVLNIATGGAAINVFARQNDIELVVVDAGVDFEFEKTLPILHKKVGFGTNNFAVTPAMTETELSQAIDQGAALTKTLFQNGCNTIGFGEMGIGNTTAASALVSALSDIAPEHSVGLGTGIDRATLKLKRDLVTSALAKFNTGGDPWSALRHFAGFEMAMMAGAMIEAGRLGMLLLIDGFIVSSVYLAASLIKPMLKDNAVFCHKSREQGHAKLLELLGAEPLLDLELRLGEGTGCALAMPILHSAVLFLEEMASFDDAGVSDKE